MFTPAARIRPTNLARLALVMALGMLCVACSPTPSTNNDFLSNIDYSGGSRGGYTDTIDP